MTNGYHKILEKEQNGLPPLPASNYELIQQQAVAHPDRTAMHFFG